MVSTNDLSFHLIGGVVGMSPPCLYIFIHAVVIDSSYYLVSALEIVTLRV